MKIPKTVRKHWVEMSFWTKEKGGWDIRFQGAIYRQLRKRGTYMAGKFLMGSSETMGHGISS